VYYSPGSDRAAVHPEADEYTTLSSRGDYVSTPSSDNYVKLKTQDQARWSYFDDYDSYDSYYASSYSPYYATGYGYPYSYGYGYGYGSGWSIGFGDPYLCWNSYFLWNSWYNPYFYNPYYGGGVLVVSKVPTSSVYNHLRTFSGSSYREGMVTRVSNSNNRSYRPAASTYYTPGTRNGNGRYLTTDGNSNSYRSFNNNNSYRNSSNTYSPSSNNNNSYRPSAAPSQPVRSYTPAPSSGGGGGFSRPGRH
jgi:hypothetical protein